jgi:hypothetical protein
MKQTKHKQQAQDMTQDKTITPVGQESPDALGHDGNSEQPIKESESAGEKELVFKKRRGFHFGSVSSSKSLLASIIVAIIVPIIVCMIMIPHMAPNKGLYSQEVGRINTNIATLTTFRSDILALGPLATKLQFDLVNTISRNALAGLEELASRVDSMGICDYNLTGTFGHYVLGIQTDKPGNFTAKLTMVYVLSNTTVLGGINATEDRALADFYTGWVTTLDRDYIPDLVCDGNASQWYVSSVSFYTAKFHVEADVSASINITFSGMNHVSDFSYVEVFPVV